MFFISVEHKSKRHSLHATYPVSYVSIVVECCQVMFDYKAKAEDELDLKKGDVVLILKKVFFPHCLTHFFMMSRSWNRLTKSFKAHCLPLWLQNYHPAKPVESLGKFCDREHKMIHICLDDLLYVWQFWKLNGTMENNFLCLFLDGGLCLAWLFGDLLCRNCLSPKTLGIVWTFALILICVWRKQKMKAGGRES